MPPVTTPRSTPADDAAEVTAQMAARIGDARRRAGLTLAAVASRNAISPAYLSQIEAGLANPTLRALVQIAAALDTDVAHLLGAGHDAAEPFRPYVSSAPLAARDHEGAGIWDLTAPGSRRLAARLVQGEPTGHLEPVTHPGEELLLVVHGRCTVHVDGAVHQLAAGDSCHLNAAASHHLSAASGGSHPLRRPERAVTVLVDTSGRNPAPPSSGLASSVPSAGPADAPEVWPATAELRDGVLHVGGVSVSDLARACGTPLYVLDEADVRGRASQWRAAADRVHYAGKAFLSAEFVRWIQDEGLHLDVCSGGELRLAIGAGMPGERIAMHGNNKSREELRAAVRHHIATVVLDCTEEIDRLADVAATEGIVQDVYVRVTPGIVADTHAYMATGGDDVKFGFPIAGGYADAAVARVLARPALRLRGVHSHLGSQILDLAGLREGARRVGAFFQHIGTEHGVRLDEVDLGGGAGIAYLPGQRRLEPVEFVAALRDGLRAAGADPRTLAVEPGRAIVGTAGVTVYEVGVVKDRAARRFVSVDGGMSDALRTSLYGAAYTAIVASRRPSGAPVPTTIVGKHCESGDVVAPSVALPGDVAAGDLLAVAATGAYHAAMASNYNLLPRPAVVAVAGGRARLLVRRETPADVLARDAGGTDVDLAAS